MAFLDSRQQRAAFLILVLGVGLVMALWPFSSGLVGAPVLYIIFAPLHRWLTRWVPNRPAALIVIAIALVLILGPGLSFIGLLASEAQALANGVIQSPLLTRIAELRIGPYDVGDQIAGAGERLAAWIGTSAFGLIGTATRLAIQLTIAFFGLYYLLCEPERVWHGIRPFIPFTTRNTELLRKRFKDVTVSTLIGTFATAVVQGGLVAAGFWAVGLSNVILWGAMTVIFAILPVVGSGVVWGPGAISLALDHRWAAAIGLALWGVLVIGNVDNLIRPYVFRRYARIHPFVTVIGAFAGIGYFGLMGILVGPLAISYFFELIRMYRQEYLDPEANAEVELVLPDGMERASPANEPVAEEGTRG
ncbi:MAG TPA: AI-2E family transporter [Gemmatimonadales bacterium]|nr:AI-2E family transporter [Gemmatimonadales bacterium]